MILDDWMYEERIGDEKGVPRRVQKGKIRLQSLEVLVGESDISAQVFPVAQGSDALAVVHDGFHLFVVEIRVLQEFFEGGTIHRDAVHCGVGSKSDIAVDVVGQSVDVVKLCGGDEAPSRCR